MLEEALSVQKKFMQSPLGSRMPDYSPNSKKILAVQDYLSQLANYSKITWLGPRIGPQMTEKTIIHFGCDYPYKLRPNHEQVYDTLDRTIAKMMQGSSVNYRSQMDFMQLTLPADLISCSTVYFSDHHHYSPAGESHFGERITLDALIR